MDRKTWKTLSQDITCEHCGATVPRRTNNQKFCTPVCTEEYHKEKWREITKTVSCKVCNDEFMVAAASKRTTCSELCYKVAISVEQQLYTDDELVHLMMLNRGYGLNRFVGFVYGKGNDTRNHSDVMISRVLDLIDYYKEENNLDLFAILNDPAGLIIMRLDEWVDKGKPTLATKMNGGPGAKARRKDYMKSYELSKAVDGNEFDRYNRRTSRKVKVYPEFNWGPYERRHREA